MSQSALKLDKQCSYHKCANSGTFSEDNCPGSDAESHHCYDCGELWWNDKGLSCDSCNNYYCPSYWQNYFIFLDCDNCDDDDSDYEYVCPPCFFNMPELWCTMPKECQCNQNMNKFKEKYDTMLNKFKKNM